MSLSTIPQNEASLNVVGTVPVVTNSTSPAAAPQPVPSPFPFTPLAPQTLAEAGLREVDLEVLVLKALLNLNTASGKQLTTQLRLNGRLIRETLDHLRADLLIVHRGSTEYGDYTYELTKEGSERARMYDQHNTYCGAAPVPLAAYTNSVALQSTSKQKIDLARFSAALSDLALSAETVSRLAQAMNASRGLFLFGNPGNGKSSVAQRLTAAYPQHVWIPRAIMMAGETLRVFDSSVHREVCLEDVLSAKEIDAIDHRWVLIQRPTIFVGGELLLEHLEVQTSSTGVLEAALQLKSNCGTLVIDDFGRQRVSPVELLNRWILPMERGIDYLTMPNGRQVAVPFDQSLVFATNLPPHSMVDEAFLRRLQFKIEMPDPSEATLRNLFKSCCQSHGVKHSEEVVSYLLDHYYKRFEMPYRCCHARDLVFQVANLCEVHGLPAELTKKNIDIVVRNYFSEVVTNS